MPKLNNTLNRAKSITLSNRPQKGRLKKKEGSDLYKLKVTDALDLDLKLFGLKDDLDIEFYALKKKPGKVRKALGKTNFGKLSKKEIRKYLKRMRRSRQKGNRDESISDISLQPGTYYLRVFGKKSKNTTKYKLRLSSPIAPSQPTEDNSPDNPTPSPPSGSPPSSPPSGSSPPSPPSGSPPSSPPASSPPSSPGTPNPDPSPVPTPSPTGQDKWEVMVPGTNLLPENIFIPSDDGIKSGTLSNLGIGKQVIFLSQILDPETQSQVFDDLFQESQFPYISFSLSGNKVFSAIEIERILKSNDDDRRDEIQDYKITLDINTSGRGIASTGSIRLPGSNNRNGNADERLSDTEITRVSLSGTAIRGSEQSEWLYGSSANDVIRGNDGEDYIFGRGGNDILSGGDDDDYLNGGPGNDQLEGGLGDNELRGGPGDDYYIIQSNDRDDNDIYEQPNGGLDTVEAFQDFTLDSRNTTNAGSAGSSRYVEVLILSEAGGEIHGEGSKNDNTIQGNSSENILEGLDGEDILIGGRGNDTLIGGAGNDILTGGSGKDEFAFNNPDEGIDQIKDFQPESDKIRLKESTFQRVFYNQSTGNLSSGTSPNQSTIFAQLETKPSSAQFWGNQPLIFATREANSRL